MRDWNVVVTVGERVFKEAIRFLRRFGTVEKTAFFNVLIMKVDDPLHLPESLAAWMSAHPENSNLLGHVAPCLATFNFQSPEEFEERAREAVLPFASSLSGKRFYVRMRRRGFKGQLSTLTEEHFLDDVVLGAARESGAASQITFEDPDAVVVVETVNNRGGIAVWAREDLQRYPFLRPD